MRTAWHLHRALWQLGGRINNYNTGDIGPQIGSVADENGNTVGHWEVYDEADDQPAAVTLAGTPRLTDRAAPAVADAARKVLNW